MVLEMDPDAPPDAEARVLLADPPFRYACVSPDCSTRGLGDALPYPQG